MLFDRLPFELFLDIFLRLSSIKDLVTCCCSSKTLMTILTGKDFTEAYTKKSAQNPYQFFRYYKTYNNNRRQYYSLQRNDANFFVGEKELIMPIDCFYHRCFNVVGVTNGVICLSDDLYGSSEIIYLWNPSIRKTVQITPSKIRPENYGVPMDYCLGFGFDYRVFDFKVVRIAYIGVDHYPCNRGALVEVYSVKTGDWKPVDSSRLVCDIRNPGSAVAYRQIFLNGYCHWIGWENGIWSGIVRYNLSNERFDQIKIPEMIKGSNCLSNDVKLVNYNGNLALIKASLEPYEIFAIWTMDDYSKPGIWVQKFSCFSGVGTRGKHHITQVLWHSMNREDSSYIVSVESKSNKSVNSVEEEEDTFHFFFRCVGEKSKKFIGHVRGKPYGFYLGSYVESLALLKEGKTVPLTVDDQESDDESADDNDYDNDATTTTTTTTTTGDRSIAN